MKSIGHMDINKHINKTTQGNIYQPIPLSPYMQGTSDIARGMGLLKTKNRRQN